MVVSSCHCGAVKLAAETAPATVTDCNCSICRRYGVLWAYYSPALIRIGEGATEVYEWGDRSIEFHRCRSCGCVTHWVAADKAIDRMGVNARLMPRAVTAEVPIRKLDGADTWTVLE